MRRSQGAAFVFAFVAIAAWSTSATFGGLLAGRLPFYALVGIIQVIAVVALAPIAIPQLIGSFRRKADVPSTMVKRGGTALFLYLVLFSVSLTAYQLLFYYAMTGTARIYANIANYLWPIFLSLFFHSVFGLGNRRPSWADNALLLLGFLGSVSLVWDFHLPQGAAGARENYLGLGAGFAAAGMAGLYMTASAKIREIGLSRQRALGMPLIYFVGLLPSSLAFAAMAITQHWTLALQPIDWFYLVWLGVITVAVAQTTWSHAISTGPSNVIPVLAYLVPVLSTSLQILVLGDQITPSILFGITFIVVASVLTAKIFRQLMPETGAAVAFMYMGFVLFFRTDIFPGLKFEDADNFPIQIYAILAAFFLSRQWQRARDEEQDLINWQRAVTKIAALADPKNTFEFQGPVQQSGSEKPNAALGNLLYQLISAIIDIDQSQSSGQLANNLTNYRHLEGKFLAFAKKLVDKEKDVQDDFQEAALDVKSYSSKWVANKTDKASYGEIVIIVALGIVSIAVYSTVASSSNIRSAIAMFVVASIAYIAVRIFDYNIRPTLLNVTELVNFQSLGDRFSLPLYLGRIELLRYGRETRMVERTAQGWTNEGVLETFHTSAKGNPLRRQLSARRSAMLFLLLGPLFVLSMNLFG
ncbi:MAG: DMT family transporter [Hyphomonas sp.]|nr:DMT family transporter [Hyphomonas sp.]